MKLVGVLELSGVILTRPSGMKGCANMETKNEINKSEQQLPLFGEHCRVYGNGLVYDQKTPREVWVRDGRILEMIEGACCWWRGDWWLFGEENRKWGDASSQEVIDNAIEVTGCDVPTLQNYAFVCKIFPFPLRKWKLSFAHYRQVAWVDDAKKREFWLETAFSQEPQLNVRELKASILAGHVVRVRDMLDAAEGKVSLNLIQGIVPKTRMWLTNVAPKIKWDKRLADQLVAEVINPMEEMCQEMRAKLLGTTADKDI